MNFRRLLSIISLTCLASGANIALATEAKADAVKLMSKASCNPLSLVQKGDVGHSAFAFYDGSGRLVGTKGMWPSGVRTNDKTDIDMANGNGCGLKTRTAYVTKARREWVQNQVASSNGTNCQWYIPVGKVGGDNSCSCVNFATRVWRQTTADWERWQFQSTPKLLGDTMWWANGRMNNGVFNSGRVW